MRELQTWERRDTVNASGFQIDSHLKTTANFRERTLFMVEGGTEEKRVG
jgi:hypothetical protein